MLRVGLTGGIGSGKTTVARIFEILGIAVYYADEAARDLMNEDSEVKASVIAHFGAASYRDGKLDRGHVASQVFNDRYKLDLLNAIVHPATLRHASAWMSAQHSAYTVKEAALIFESGSAGQLDLVIGVSAPEPLRLSRIMKRNGMSEADVRARIASQLDESIKMRLCDFVLVNDEQSLLVPQVIALHQKLLELAAV